MKETTAYMMTDMMKTVITAGTGTTADISGLYQAGKTGTSNYADNEIGKLTKNAYSNLVTPDELFVGYTPEYAMAVWTGYTNRLTPVLDDGIKVATDVYNQMMLYLANSNNSGNTDWTQPSGLYGMVLSYTSTMVRTTTITTTMSQVIPLISIRMKNHRLALRTKKINLNHLSLLRKTLTIITNNRMEKSGFCPAFF